MLHTHNTCVLYIHVRTRYYQSTQIIHCDTHGETLYDFCVTVFDVGFLCLGPLAGGRRNKFSLSVAWIRINNAMRIGDVHQKSPKGKIHFY